MSYNPEYRAFINKLSQEDNEFIDDVLYGDGLVEFVSDFPSYHEEKPHYIPKLHRARR